MHPLDIHPASIGEEHQKIVSAGSEEPLDEIRCLAFDRRSLARGHSNDPPAASSLGAVGTNVGAFD